MPPEPEVVARHEETVPSIMKKEGTTHLEITVRNEINWLQRFWNHRLAEVVRALPAIGTMAIVSFSISNDLYSRNPVSLYFHVISQAIFSSFSAILLRSQLSILMQRLSTRQDLLILHEQGRLEECLETIIEKEPELANSIRRIGWNYDIDL